MLSDWLSGPLQPDYAVDFIGLPLYWITRFGKCLALSGALVIVVELIGEQRIREYALSVRSVREDMNDLVMLRTRMTNVKSVVEFFGGGCIWMLFFFVCGWMWWVKFCGIVMLGSIALYPLTWMASLWLGMYLGVMGCARYVLQNRKVNRFVKFWAVIWICLGFGIDLLSS